MERYTIAERTKTILLILENVRSIIATQRVYQQFYGVEDFLYATVRPQAFPFHSWFQQDGATAYTARSTMNMFREEFPPRRELFCYK